MTEQYKTGGFGQKNQVRRHTTQQSAGQWVAFAVTGKMNTMDWGNVDLIQEEMV